MEVTSRQDPSPPKFAVVDFLSNVVQKPSPIHGRGLFAKKMIRQGVYVSRDQEEIKRVLHGEMLSTNSTLPPLWKTLLFTNGDANIPLDERLSKFRREFAKFVTEEKSKASLIERILMSNGKPSELQLNVISDIVGGSEILRAYGPRWLSMKYHHLKNSLIVYQKMENEGKHSWMFLDQKELLVNIYRRTLDEDNPRDTAKDLTMQSGKQLNYATPEEADTLLNILEILALENFGKGNELFDTTFKSCLLDLKRKEECK